VTWIWRRTSDTGNFGARLKASGNRSEKRQG
jgi:hypothetical protein